MNIKYRIKDLWTNLIYAWPDNIRRIIAFIPILWKDWDFDFSPGGYRLLRKKLELLEPCLTDGHLLNGEKYGRQVKKVIIVLDRLIEDEYDIHELEAVDPDWMSRKIKSIKWGKVHIESYHLAEKKKQRDIDFVFDVMKRWHRHWWD